jgi:hypothetical protein
MLQKSQHMSLENPTQFKWFKAKSLCQDLILKVYTHLGNMQSHSENTKFAKKS